MNASAEINQQDNVPMCINSGNCLFPTRIGIQGFSMPLYPSFKLEQNNVHGSCQCLSSHFMNSLSTPTTYLKAKESLYSAGPSVVPVPKSNIGSDPKGYLIVDQSGNKKRLMYTSLCHPAYIPSTVVENHRQRGCIEEEWIDGGSNSFNYFSHIRSKENHVAGDESEMHEDTEEIDALLYSDDDSIGYTSDDDVTSTGRSPELFDECYQKEEQHREITTEVASSDGPRKRQRVHEGGQIKSLPMDTVTCAKVNESQKFANDAESSYGIDQEEGDGMDFHFCKFSSKRDDIKETLKVLESIVPDAKGKDPLLVIDEVIDYLKSLKHEARDVLGVSCY